MEALKIWRWKINTWKDALYHVIREMQIKTRFFYTEQIAPHADEMWSNRELSAGGNKKWYSHHGRQFGSFLQSQTLLSYDPMIQIFSTYPKVSKTCPHKTLDMVVYSSYSWNCKNLEATKRSLNRWIYKLWHIQTMEYCCTLNDPYYMMIFWKKQNYGNGKKISDLQG